MNGGIEKTAIKQIAAQKTELTQEAHLHSS